MYVIIFLHIYYLKIIKILFSLHKLIVIFLTFLSICDPPLSTLSTTWICTPCYLQVGKWHTRNALNYMPSISFPYEITRLGFSEESFSCFSFKIMKSTFLTGYRSNITVLFQQFWKHLIFYIWFLKHLFTENSDGSCWHSSIYRCIYIPRHNDFWR